MEHYIQSAILDNVFSEGPFQNTMANFKEIVQREMVEEYEKHLLPMMMYTCRNYLARLRHIQANVNFQSFSRTSPPIPLPASHEEHNPLPHPTHRFSAYGMPFPVENGIQKYRPESDEFRDPVSADRVHPESRTLLLLVRPDKYFCSVQY